MKRNAYHVWRVGTGNPALIATITARDYMDAVQTAVRRFGPDVEVFLPPSPPQSGSMFPIDSDGCELMTASK